MNQSNGNSRKGGSYDPFWDESSVMLLSAIIGYLKEKELYDKEKGTLLSVLELIKMGNRVASSGSPRGKSMLDEVMKKHKEKMERLNEHSWAFDRYCEYNTAPDKTHATINVCAIAKLSTIDTLATFEANKSASSGVVPKYVFPNVPCGIIMNKSSGNILLTLSSTSL